MGIIPDRAMCEYARTLPRITDLGRVIDPARIAAQAVVDEVATAMLVDDIRAAASEPRESDLTFADFVAESPRVTAKPATGGLADHRELANVARDVTNRISMIAATSTDPQLDAAAARLRVVTHQVEALAEHVDRNPSITVAHHEAAMRAYADHRSVVGWRIVSVFALVAGVLAGVSL